MIQLDNYHRESMEVESQYADELLLLFGGLLTRLNDIKILTKRDIDNTVNLWKIENINDIQEINTIFVEKAENIANSQIPPQNSYQNERKVDSLAVANDQMLNITTEYVRQKFIELSVLEQNYNYSDKASTDFLQSIASTTQDKIVLFTTMSTIENVKEFLFDNAIANDFSEYEWATQRDSRVRPSHAAMEGKWVKINQPPRITGYLHVGQDWNCRCWARRFR